MPQENMDITRRGYEAFNRGDFDAAIALCRPDVEFIRPGIELPLKGREAVRAWAGSGIELGAGSWAVWTLDDEGFIARGEMFMLDQQAEAIEAAGLSE